MLCSENKDHYSPFSKTAEGYNRRIFTAVPSPYIAPPSRHDTQQIPVVMPKCDTLLPSVSLEERVLIF